MTVFYDPIGYKLGPKYAKPWAWMKIIDGVYGDRPDAGLSSWVVPGTWPEWML